MGVVWIPKCYAVLPTSQIFRFHSFPTPTPQSDICEAPPRRASDQVSSFYLNTPKKATHTTDPI